MFRGIGETFLEETWSIFREKNQFFKKFLLHIIQCDNRIQEDKIITTKEEMEAYIKKLTIKGYGGTDFRPVFDYIKDLKLKNLKGLIYFTDGYGMFPTKNPDYKVAFVLPETEFAPLDLPVWATRITIDRRFFSEH
ncbi:hypothetical protein P261_00034 [Lachnospiraceae bacterium TWA4]|nr:hypothetical protein P261_00034 [Lachnospiraceae bacterium TWA4]